MSEAEAILGLSCDDGSILERPLVSLTSALSRADRDELVSGVALIPAADSSEELIEAIEPVEATDESGPRPMTREAQGALRGMFERDFQFIWRVLRRLGVPPQNIDDAVQQVFCVAARKIEAIDPAKSRSFLLGTALRIAAESRRTSARSREVASDALDGEPSTAPTPEQMTQKKQALELLDSILDAMPFELRAVFVLFEVEGISTDDIAPMLRLPRGTVASRLRRARDEFQAIAKRQQARSATRAVARGGKS